MSKRDDAIKIMNRMGASRSPFLFVIDFAMEEPIVLPPGEAAREGIFYNLNGCTNWTGDGAGHARVVLGKSPIPHESYERSFQSVQDHLRRGDSYLLNLTCSTPITLNIGLEEIFRRSRAKYRVLVRDKFVVFSPEIFVRINQGRIFSHPMKGTISADVTDAEKRVLASVKEKAEHTTIVDLIRNDLSTVADHVRVDRFRYVDRIDTHAGSLLQVSSEISGELPRNFRTSIGSIIFSLLPAGSVTGAPKKRTVEIINAVETHTRGYYTGIVGLFDGENLDSGVMIRFIEQSPKGLVYKSGGGITILSDVRSEYREMLEKVYVPIV